MRASLCKEEEMATKQTFEEKRFKGKNFKPPPPPQKKKQQKNNKKQQKKHKKKTEKKLAHKEEIMCHEVSTKSWC